MRSPGWPAGPPPAEAPAESCVLQVGQEGARRAQAAGAGVLGALAQGQARVQRHRHAPGRRPRPPPARQEGQEGLQRHVTWQLCRTLPGHAARQPGRAAACPCRSCPSWQPSPLPTLQQGSFAAVQACKRLPRTGFTATAVCSICLYSCVPCACARWPGPMSAPAAAVLTRQLTGQACLCRCAADMPGWP